MPRFIDHGPDIPERLLWSHEEGRVVFFCGAGVSYPAGLPSFKGLVDQIYSTLGTPQEPSEAQAYDSNQYDAALDLLERRFPGQRLAVRTALLQILKPRWRRKNSTTTHESLLTLATDRKGSVRLVTTNFDRIFDRLIRRYKPRIPCFSAPLLPIPKPHRWNGVVHLHGLLPDSVDERELNSLILTSGDFGLAYLIERWAARFVSEVFRNYTVCFVGYSINDPVLRYMMDALAADEMLGQPRLEAFAFGPFLPNAKDEAMRGWEARGVTPLLYEILPNDPNHIALHHTLWEWSATYRDGVRGKEMIVARHATTAPLTDSRFDYAVGRVLWALTDDLAAKHFADLNPVPPLTWLEPLAKAQFHHDDLMRFGVVPTRENDDQLAFSLVRRPPPYSLAGWMSLFENSGGTRWDRVMGHLARWLLRHLGDPNLILWLAKQDGRLCENLVWLIRTRIEQIDKLIQDANQPALEEIRAAAPNAIPSPLMRILWRLLLSGRVKCGSNRSDLYDWVRRFKREGLPPILRMELRELLTPRILISEEVHFVSELRTSQETTRVRDLVDWELVLSSDHPHSVLQSLSSNPNWQSSLADFLNDVSTLLRDSLDLRRELGGADDSSDHSYIHQPSISPHPQNTDFHGWTVLIDLTRDAWLAVLQRDPVQARLAAQGWWQTPYPLFKRLSFFAATHGHAITSSQGLDWLLADNHRWLWSSETKHEAMRLLAVLAPKLDEANIARLESAILSGPPREMYREDIKPEQWTLIKDQDIWFRLELAKTSGAELGEVARNSLAALATRYPDWRLSPDGRDEFPFWMSRNWGSSEQAIPVATTPRRREELVAWLKDSTTDPWREDGWHQRCLEDFPGAALALFILARAGHWPIDRWNTAIRAWTGEKFLRRSWRYGVHVIAVLPNHLIKPLSNSLSYWLKAQAKTFKGSDDLFLDLITRLIDFNGQEASGSTDDPVFDAINHPVGHATKALLHWWYRQKPHDGEGFPSEMRKLLVKLTDKEVPDFRHARLVLASHLVSLFRTDEEWARTYLLPLFDWKNNEARGVWLGFLMSPGIYRPLMATIKNHFLTTSKHLEQLGEQGEQYAAVLTFAALDPGETFSQEELAAATSALPEKGLLSAAASLSRAIEGAGDRRSEFWHNRIVPYFKTVWPKSKGRITPAISENIARICLAARDAFPQAVAELRHWLIPVPHPDLLTHRLFEYGLCERFPADALLFLSCIISDQTQWLPSDLNACLERIQQTEEQLASDKRFISLLELLRRNGDL